MPVRIEVPLEYSCIRRTQLQPHAAFHAWPVPAPPVVPPPPPPPPGPRPPVLGWSRDIIESIEEPLIISSLLCQFEVNWLLALVAYNCGPVSLKRRRKLGKHHRDIAQFENVQVFSQNSSLCDDAGWPCPMWFTRIY